MAVVLASSVVISVLIVVVFNLGCWIFNERSNVWRKLAPAGSSWLVISKRGAKRPQTWFCWDLLDERSLYTGPLGTTALTLFRAIQLAVFVAVIIFGNAVYGAAGGAYFIYFTNWTFVLFGLNGLLGTALTLQERLAQRRPALLPGQQQAPPAGTSYPRCAAMTGGWRARSCLHHLLLETVTAASVMLTIFYWLADYVPGSPVRADNPFKHGMSALLLLLDLGLSAAPLVSYHCQVVIGFGSVYLLFLWLYFAGTGLWVYRALDWSRPLSPAFYLATPMLLILGFVIMFAVVGIRELAVSHSCFLECCNCCLCCSARRGKDSGAATTDHPQRANKCAGVEMAAPAATAMMTSCNDDSSSEAVQAVVLA